MMRYLEAFQSLIKGGLFFLRVLVALGRFSDSEKQRFIRLILCKELPFEKEEMEKFKLFLQFPHNFIKEKLLLSQSENHRIDNEVSAHGLTRVEHLKLVSAAAQAQKERDLKTEFAAIDERVIVLERELQQLNKLSSMFGSSK